MMRLLVNFRCPPLQVFKFSMTPPPLEFGIEGVQSGILSYHTYNLQFLKMSDILKHVLLLNKNNDLLLVLPQLAPDEMAPSLKKTFLIGSRGEIIKRLLFSIIQRSRSLEHVHVVVRISWIRVTCWNL